MATHSRREFMGYAAAAGGAALGAGSSGQATGANEAGGAMKPPNFVIFLTDDQGYGDLSCMGAADLQTPHLDAMAAGGVRFTDWYSNSPVCSPSRAALLTGRYPGNAGVRSILAGHRTASGLPPETPTLATALKALGYRTAMFGKWHLGLAEACRPHRHGFDEWFGFMAGCIDYYSHIFYWGMAGAKGLDPTHDLWENGREVYEDGRYFTELITERATAFIREAAAADQPFFLYIPYNAPHYPMHAPQRYLDRFPDLPWDRRIMAAMLGAVDDSVGAVCAELDAQGLFDNTCTVFTSDNGPSRETRNWLDGTRDPYYGGSAGGLKGHKFSLFEGGIRVPGIVRWPDRIPAGQVLDAPVASMDVFPTFVKAAGGDPAAYELDGRDLMPVFAEGAASPHEALFWEMNDQTAIRRDRWKLVINGRLVEGAPPEDAVFLADLRSEEGEWLNRRDERPDIVQELEEMAKTWRAGIETRWREEWQPRIQGLA